MTTKLAVGLSAHTDVISSAGPSIIELENCCKVADSRYDDFGES